jgi:hypothetical protein
VLLIAEFFGSGRDGRTEQRTDTEETIANPISEGLIVEVDPNTESCHAGASHEGESEEVLDP